MRARPRTRRGGGFTLLEMLVTLIVVSLVATIVWQAMVQLARIESLLADGTQHSRAVALRIEWVRHSLSSLVPAEAARPSERMTGDPRVLRGLSLDVPQWPAPGLAFMQLQMRSDAVDDTTRLELAQIDADSGQVRSRTALLSWPGQKGRFRYLDDAQRWSDVWPPPMRADAPALPAAVLVETGLAQAPVIIAAPQASRVPLPSRRVVEGL